jgi:hypothetical protein
MSALGSGRTVRAVTPAARAVAPAALTVTPAARTATLAALVVALVCLGAIAAAAVAAAHPARTPPVRGLDACRAGPHCDYGAAYERFSTWGNVAPRPLGDCTLAAAADWEQIVLGVHAHAAAIRSDFTRAGGSVSTGLAQAALWSYWQHEGIEGIYLTAVHGYAADRTNIESAVRTFAALIVELSFASDNQLAQYQLLPGELHDVVVDGFTPAGPLVVTWGQTLQMTWAQWDQEASNVWAITTTRPRVQSRQRRVGHRRRVARAGAGSRAREA